MTRRKTDQRSRLRLICLLCVLSILVALLPACGGPDSISDDAVRDAAEVFARALKATGKTAAQIIELARDEAQKWGPKAQLFIDTVIAYLQQ